MEMLAGAVVAPLIGLVIGFPLMWLWNWLMPEIFGLPEVTFWEAWGLFVLASLLVRSSCSSSRGL